MGNLAGLDNDIQITILVLIFGAFAHVVLSQFVGSILLTYAIIYGIAIVATRRSGSKYAFQWSRQPRDLSKMVGIVFAIFIVFVFVSEIVMQTFSLGSSLLLYSSAFNPILTIDTPAIKMLIWGIIIPVLETMFFIGVVGFFLAKISKTNRFDLRNVNMYIIILSVAAVAALFHIVSQFLQPGPLIMDMILFGTGMFMTFYYQELKQAALLHIFVNVVAMAVLLKWIPIGVA